MLKIHNIAQTSFCVLYTDLILRQFNQCVPEVHMYELCTIIWTSIPYASIIQHADMTANHSTSVCKNLTGHNKKLPSEHMTL